MPNPVREAWNGLPGIGKGLVGVGVLVVGGIATKKGITAFQKNQREKKADKNKTAMENLISQSEKPITTVVTNPDGSKSQVTATINLATVAKVVRDAITIQQTPFGSFKWVDQDRIVRTLQPVPKQYIPDLEKTWMKLYGNDLRGMLIFALSDSNWDKINYLFT